MVIRGTLAALADHRQQSDFSRAGSLAAASALADHRQQLNLAAPGHWQRTLGPSRRLVRAAPGHWQRTLLASESVAFGNVCCNR